MSPLKTSQLRRLCLLKLISVTDYVMFKRIRRLRNEATRNHQPFLLSKISDNECVRLFRFTGQELRRLRGLLLPSNCKTCKGDKFTGLEMHFSCLCCLHRQPWWWCDDDNDVFFYWGLEGLCVLLRRFCYPNRLSDISGLFGRTTAAVSRIFNWTLNHIYRKFSHLVQSMNNKWLTAQCFQHFCEVTKLQNLNIFVLTCNGIFR